MGIFTNARETKVVHELLKECGQFGSKVYFSNLYYLTENEEKVEILWVYAPKNSVYSELEVCVDDEVKDLWTSPHMVVTMVYLEVQKLAREYKKEEL